MFLLSRQYCEFLFKLGYIRRISIPLKNALRICGHLFCFVFLIINSMILSCMELDRKKDVFQRLCESLFSLALPVYFKYF